MKQSTPAALMLVTAASLFGCTPEADIDQAHEGLDTTLSCPAGEVGWNFTEHPVSASSSDAVSKNPTQTPPNGSPPSTFTIAFAQCGTNGYTFTSAISEECDGRTRCIYRTPCQPDETWRITYRCSGDEGKIFTSPPPNVTTKLTGRTLIELPCVQKPLATTTTPARTACVPEQCHGATRRDGDLACVADFNRPTVELERTLPNASKQLMKVSFPSGALEVDHRPRRLVLDGVDQFTRKNHLQEMRDNWQIYPRSVITFKGVKVLAPVPVGAGETGRIKGRVALWLADEYRKKGTKNAPVKVWRCLMHSVELSKYTTSTAVGDQFRFITLDRERFTLPNDCTNESNGYVYRELTAKKLGLTRGQFEDGYELLRTRINASFDLEGANIVVPAGSTKESACAPNPIDFFWLKAAGGYDMVAYHEQRSIEVAYEVGNIEPGQVTIAQSNRSEIGIGDVRTRQTELRVKAFGPPRGGLRVDADWYLAHDRNGYWQKEGFRVYELNAKVRTYLVPKDAMGTQVPAPKDGYWRLGETTVYKAGGLGQTVAARYPMGEALRAELLRKGSPIEIGDTGRRTFELLTCIELVDAKTNFKRTTNFDHGEEDGTYYLRTAPSGVQVAPMGLTTAPEGCRWASTPILIRLDKAVTPLEPLSLGDWSGESNPASTGDSRTDQTLDNDGERNCDANATGGSRCATTASNGVRGTGVFSGSWASIEGNGEIDTGSPFSGGGAGEILSFNVLDDEEEKPWMGPGGGAKITLTPPWEDIREALSKTYQAPDWKTGQYAGMMGLGVGIGYKQPVYFGPVQIGIVVYTVSVGLSIALELEWSTDDEYPCLGESSACASVMGSMDLPAALNKCYATGGRLGEYSTATEAQKVKSALDESEHGAIWLGSQIGDEYAKPQCMSTWSSSLCAPEHITVARWLTTDEDFATATAMGAATLNSAYIFFPGTAQTTVSVPAGKPERRAVALTRGGTIDIRSINDPLPSVCVYEPATEDQSHTFRAAIPIGLAAGIGVAFCTPTDEAGVCLAGSVNLVGVALTPNFNYTYHRLTNAAGQKATRSNVNFSFDWELRILEGAIDVKLVLGPFELSYNLFQFDGLKIPASIAGGKFVDLNFPSIEAFK